MSPLTLKANATLVLNPTAHFRVPNKDINMVSFESRPLKGEFYRVHPKTITDVRFLAALIHNEEKFVVDGDGIVISEKAYYSL